MAEPYLRRSSGVAPSRPPERPGDVVSYAGRWAGEPVDVVYNPRRHDVMFLLGRMQPELREQLEQAGWRVTRDDGRRQLWVRDKVVAARSGLARGHAASPPGLDVA